MPPESKIADGIGKVALKHVVGDLLPHDLIWRRKQGFGAPVAQWFREDLGTVMRERLRTSALQDVGWLRMDRIEAIADLHASGRADRSFQLWNLLNLSVWFDEWIAGRASAR
jgi:asparagine synthase (glutamine-hydrolysing)